MIYRLNYFLSRIISNDQDLFLGYLRIEHSTSGYFAFGSLTIWRKDIPINQMALCSEHPFASPYLATIDKSLLLFGQVN